MIRTSPATDDDSRPAKLTANQEKVLAAIRRFKEREGCGATVADVHRRMRGRLSGDAIRSNLVRLRGMGLVWSHGVDCNTNATCWHPDPPELGQTHLATAKS